MDPKTGNLAIPVDLIRTFAIVLVIVLHASTETVTVFNQMSPEGVTLWWTTNIYDSLARPAVPLFIMLSGMLLLQPAKLNESLGVFFKKRLNRIALPSCFWGSAYFCMTNLHLRQRCCQPEGLLRLCTSTIYRRKVLN